MDDPIVGQQLGNYRVHHVLGRGGMATVYYGWDENLQRPVAIKLLDARYRHNPAYAQRFVEEARAVATWRHENVLQVYFAGQKEDLYFFAMEHIDGPDLGELMRGYVEKGELMPHEDVLQIGRAVAAALDYAHKKQVIHRDVKPSNVMVAKDGRVVLTDFGLALNVQRGSLGETFGTPHYIAPEQARNSAMAVPQSDLYSLGVILYELLTGSVPFDDPSPTSLALQHITTPPPPPRDLNPRLNEATAAVLLQALAKKLEERYQTGKALMDTLSEAIKSPGDGLDATPLPPLPGGVAPPVLSRDSVAERVSLYLPPPPASAGSTPAQASQAGKSTTYPPPAPPAAAFATNETTPQKRGVPMGWIAGGILGVIGLMVLFMLLGPGEDEPAETAVATFPSTSAATAVFVGEENQPTATDEPTVVAPSLPEATALPSTTIALSDTAVPPTATPGAAPTTAFPTATMMLPTATVSPAAVSPTAATVPPTPIPEGQRVTLIYDSSGFYFQNPNAERIRASSLRFEALNGGNNSAGPIFEGVLWAQFYSFIDQNRCDRIELNQASSYLRPSQCRNYNATVTLSPDDDAIFWLKNGNIARFRVLWNNAEAGRCPATEGNATTCEVYLP